MIIVAAIISALLFFFIPAGLSKVLVFAWILAISYVGILNFNKSVIGFGVIASSLLDVICLQTWGISSLIFLICSTIMQLVHYRFGSRAHWLIMPITLCGCLVYQVLIDRGFDLSVCISAGGLSFILVQIFAKLYPSHDIQIHHNSKIRAPF